MFLPVHYLVVAGRTFDLVYAQLPAKCLNWSYMKLVSVSETIFLGSLNYANTILAAMIRLPADKPPTFFIIGNLW